MLKVSIFVLGFCYELWQNSCNYAKFVKGDVQHPSLQKKFFRQKFLAWCVLYSLNLFQKALLSSSSAFTDAYIWKMVHIWKKNKVIENR